MRRSFDERLEAYELEVRNLRRYCKEVGVHLHELSDVMKDGFVAVSERGEDALALALRQIPPLQQEIERLHILHDKVMSSVEGLLTVVERRCTGG